MTVGQRAQGAQADGESPAERKDGLVCVMADFHAQMEVVAIAWKVMFRQSSGDIGSLYSARNILNAVNVSSEPKKEYFRNGELLDKFTQSLVILGI